MPPAGRDRQTGRPAGGHHRPRPWADSAYQGILVDWATTALRITLVIVHKLAGQVGFVVLHRRWAVERSFSWINRCRRTVRDYERLPQHHAAMVQWAMVIIMTRRLARYQTTHKPTNPAATISSNPY